MLELHFFFNLIFGLPAGVGILLYFVLAVCLIEAFSVVLSNFVHVLVHTFRKRELYLKICIIICNIERRIITLIENTSLIVMFKTHI